MDAPTSRSAKSQHDARRGRLHRSPGRAARHPRPAGAGRARPRASVAAAVPVEIEAFEAQHHKLIWTGGCKLCALAEREPAIYAVLHDGWHERGWRADICYRYVLACCDALAANGAADNARRLRLLRSLTKPGILYHASHWERIAP